MTLRYINSHAIKKNVICNIKKNWQNIILIYIIVNLSIVSKSCAIIFIALYSITLNCQQDWTTPRTKTPLLDQF